MARVKRWWMIFGLLLPLIACSQTITITIETPTPVASFTPFVAGTESAFASPTPWIGGTETALAFSAAETQRAQDAPAGLASPTPFLMEKPTDFSPVLYGGKLFDSTFFLLLGGASRETWMAPEMSAARFSGEMTYSLHSLTQEAKYFLWGKSPAFSPTCPGYTIGTDAMLDEAGFVGVMDGWQVTKRPVTELLDDGQLYRQTVIDWLKAEGIPAPQVDSIQAYRVDIEGDGTDEVFISATQLDESQHTARSGDYSLILMRQVIENEVITRLVLGDVYHSQASELTFPRTYSIANFIDLNQDGRLEVVVDIQKWEGFGARVLQIDGEDVIQTLGAEC